MGLFKTETHFELGDVAYSRRCSRSIPCINNDRAQRCLTSGIEWESVFAEWYEHSLQNQNDLFFPEGGLNNCFQFLFRAFCTQRTTVRLTKKKKREICIVMNQMIMEDMEEHTIIKKIWLGFVLKSVFELSFKRISSFSSVYQIRALCTWCTHFIGLIFENKYLQLGLFHVLPTTTFIFHHANCKGHAISLFFFFSYCVNNRDLRFLLTSTIIISSAVNKRCKIESLVFLW